MSLERRGGFLGNIFFVSLKGALRYSFFKVGRCFLKKGGLGFVELFGKPFWLAVFSIFGFVSFLERRGEF